MKLESYLRAWLLLCLLLAMECYALNFAPELSMMLRLRSHGWLPRDLDLSPLPGKTLSMWLGWAGFGIMCLTNLYSLRKRLPQLRRYWRLPRWLDFHIFCGLAGPTLIVFHSDFHVSGLVAISFWCMVISLASGVVGRYFYLQVVKQQSDLQGELERLELRLKAFGEEQGSALKAGQLEVAKQAVLRTAGLQSAANGGFLGLIWRTLLSDLRLGAALAGGLSELPPPVRIELVRFATTSRKLRQLQPYQQIMGYWHSFHVPFAIVMYIVAVIHIVSALLFMPSG